MSNQTFAVIGASGYVGAAVVRELASRGHAVRAIARDVSKIPPIPGVQAVAADVNDAHFGSQLQGVDAVLSAFNPGWTNPNIAADFTRGYEAILAAAQKAAVPYLLIVGGAGSLYVSAGVQLVDTPEFPRAIYDGANAARHLLRHLQGRRDVPWSFISPPAALGATGGYSEERTGRYRLGGDDLLMVGLEPAGMSVADLAIAIADDLQQRAHLHQRFTAAAA